MLSSFLFYLPPIDLDGVFSLGELFPLRIGFTSLLLAISFALLTNLDLEPNLSTMFCLSLSENSWFPSFDDLDLNDFTCSLASLETNLL